MNKPKVAPWYRVRYHATLVMRRLTVIRPVPVRRGGR
jgi:hypothetical protein